MTLAEVRIVGVTGLPGVKKHLVCSMLHSRHGIPGIGLSAVVRRVASCSGAVESYACLRDSGLRLREEGGRDIVARMSVPDILGLESYAATVDGIRDVEEAAYFRKHAAAFVLVAVHASQSTRYSFRHWCDWTDNPFTNRERFCVRDQEEIRLGVAEALALADYHVVNEPYMPALESQVDRFHDWLVAEARWPPRTPPNQQR